MLCLTVWNVNASSAEITASFELFEDVEDDEGESKDVSRNRCKVEAVFFISLFFCAV